MIFSDLFPLQQTTDWKAKHLGLDRMRELMRLLGNPQQGLRFVHVAGTNGKGSVCAMLASILKEAGFHTGLYISPNLLRVNERIQIDGAEISDEVLRNAANRVRHAADGMDDAPLIFEQLTAMALLCFQAAQCDIVVLEVGMGGRLDATNVIDPPETAVICNIGLDHTEVLGDTVAKVAAEKAGIIKSGSPVVLLAQSGEAEAVVRQVCAQRNAPLTVTDPAQQTLLGDSLDCQIFSYRQRRDLCLSLLGPYQFRNAAAVLDAVDILQKRGFSISEDAVAAGLEHVRWPGRFEVLQKHPLLLLDGAHNPDGVTVLNDCLEHYLPDEKLVFVMGVMADKDYRTMLSLIAPRAERIFTVTPPNGRALSSAELKTLIEAETSVPVTDADTPENGVRMALAVCNPDQAVCAFGSLYQVADIRRMFGKS